MPENRPTYQEGHLIVAAIRVLENQHGRPPSVEEIAGLIGHSVEISHMFIRGLEASAILRVMQTPFETAVEIVNHLALEELSAEEKKVAFGDDLEEFKEKKRKEQEAMEAFFASGGVDEEKKKKLDKLADDFEAFRNSRKPPPGGDK